MGQEADNEQTTATPVADTTAHDVAADNGQIEKLENGRPYLEIALEQPIKRGSEEIKVLKVRKPLSGDLQGGINFQKIAQFDSDTTMVLLTRTALPLVSRNEVLNMDIVDLAQCAGVYEYFLHPAAQRKTLLQ